MILDLLVVLVVGYGFYTGYSRGIIDTVFDVLSIIIAILVSLKLSPFLITFLNDSLNFNPGVGFIVGFVATFFLVMMLIRFIGNKLESVFKAVKINFVNKIAGGALMGFIFALLFSSLILLAGNLNLLPKNMEDRSITYSTVRDIPEVSKGIFTSVKPIFSGFWNKTVETIDEIKARAKEAEG